MPTILITGANRGIGLELARQYVADGWDVIGTARSPERAGELNALGVQVEQLDAADPTHITALADRLKGRAIDVMIANAGVMGPLDLDPEGWVETFRTNSIGPTLLAEALKPNVLAGGQKKMVAITSRMGSIGDNSAGGYAVYRSSKAALNAAWTSLALDWRADGLTLAMLHPGWVQTDMGGANAAVTPQESVAGLRKVIASLTPNRSGVFKAFDGADIPW